MKSYKKIFCLVMVAMALGASKSYASILAESQAVEKEKIVANQLQAMMSQFRSTHYMNDDEENYQISHACLYVVYLDWQQRYLDVLAATPLDKVKISGLNQYAKFAASLAKGFDGLDQTYVNLVDNVELYISKGRSDGSWAAGVGALELANPQLQLLGQNLNLCYDSDIMDDLAESLIKPNIVAFSSVAAATYTAVFDNAQGNHGISLNISIENNLNPSTIEGVKIVEGNDDYLVNPGS